MKNPVYDFNGAKVLVTGGTSGIGLATATAYRNAGADVLITGTRPAASDYSEDLSGLTYRQLDVEDKDAIRTLTASIDRLDILVNNAGVALPAIGLDEYDPEIFERAINMLLVSAFRMAQGLAERLAKSGLPGGASIIGVGSMASYFGIPVVPGYGAAKTGLLGLTRALAVKWGPRNIRVNAVAPGLTRSRMMAANFANEDYLRTTLDRTPLGRLGEPEDCAAAILFLTSPAAAWITGQMLPIDGGFTVSG